MPKNDNGEYDEQFECLPYNEDEEQQNVLVDYSLINKTNNKNEKVPIGVEPQGNDTSVTR